MFMRAIPGWAVVVLLAAGPAMAAEERAINLDVYQTALLQASGHPNELNRWHGIWNYDNGRHDDARKFFERAATSPCSWVCRRPPPVRGTSSARSKPPSVERRRTPRL